ncbi:MAG: hypothetical protein BWY87_01673 [Deltaproteobacteria bacterium ADurb.Bin510]|nr:MAG: hypothetical protein BWY87_01673 [Deltaproteobacteria bacterium ADurb.Bin510]
MHSERRDGHWLRADHAAPEAPENAGIAARRGWRRLGRGAAVVNWLDALDYYCFWKLFDALCDAAFYGLSREYALGDTPEQRFMGLWSDGRPVRPLTVEIPATGSGRD